MTDDQKKNYEEAARKYEGNTPDEASAGRYHGFLAGATHAHNSAIDAAIKVLLYNPGAFEEEEDQKRLIGELQKLKI